ncbi:MAG TPA: flagella basal body P-ring formation protein FlgA, partial [Firmicutes bacterium]|nr:flagella basal body P-ring formation protein FlgA [Bacillota bacterium]
EVGAALFKVVLSKDSESRVLNISGKVRATALVYRALRDLSYQSVLNSADFELIEMELENGKEFVGDLQSGIRTTKLIKQGEILRKDWFQPVPLISKDQEVKVTVKDENVAVNILGIAKADGWLGDEIMVTNPLSHKSFKSRVTGNGIVELNLQ